MPERIDRRGEHKTALKKNKQIILATQDVCGICGAPVDKTLKAPDPLSPTVDHIIPVAKGGHPSSLENLQLAHRWCNLHKGDRLLVPGTGMKPGRENAGLKNDRGIKNTTVYKTAARNEQGGDNYGGTSCLDGSHANVPDGKDGPKLTMPHDNQRGAVYQPHAYQPAADLTPGANQPGMPDGTDVITKPAQSPTPGKTTANINSRDVIDNDDLPLHADWCSLVW